jgi:hypothetical protein
MWCKTQRQIFDKAKTKLVEIFNGVCETHGLVHAIVVMLHCRKALINHPGTPIPEDKQTLILLAAMCHDADDTKYWKDSNNTSVVLDYCSDGLITPEEKQYVLRLIDYVSCSKNWNRIPDEAIEHPEVLYPRFSDRLEALGHIGVKRAYIYSMKQGNPMYTDGTPKPKNLNELWSCATTERFENYTGGSQSMMDHFYDKLLHIGRFETSNEYLKQMADSRTKIIIDVCLHYGQTGTLHPVFADFSKK